jgi:hypothetical protein
VNLSHEKKLKNQKRVFQTIQNGRKLKKSKLFHFSKILLTGKVSNHQTDFSLNKPTSIIIGQSQNIKFVFLTMMRNRNLTIILLFLICVNITWMIVSSRKNQNFSSLEEQDLQKIIIPDKIIYPHANKKYYQKRKYPHQLLSETTIITQISEERLHRLELLSDLFPGTISCTLFR